MPHTREEIARMAHASQPPDQRPLLLLIATGGRDYREYLLRSIATRYRVHLILGA